MPAEPLRTLTVTLTTADALAYEQAAAQMAPLGTLALIVWLGLWGAAALLLPVDWAGLRLSWSFGLLVAVLLAIGYVLALLLLALRQWRRARRRVRRPQELTVAEWPDRLEVAGAGPPRTLVFSGVRRSILTRTHLFLEDGRDPVILPRRAFLEEGSLEALEKRVAEAPRATPGPAPKPAPVVEPLPSPPAAEDVPTPPPAATSPPEPVKPAAEPAKPSPPPPPPAPVTPAEVSAVIAALAAPLEPPPLIDLPPLPPVDASPSAPASPPAAADDDRPAPVDPAAPSA